MSELFSEGADRVQEFLISKNSKSRVALLPESTATAQEAANVLKVELYEIGKSIVLGNEDNTVVVVICGDKKVNIDYLSKELDFSDLKPLEANGVKIKTGFVIGGVSPFSLPPNVILIVDSHLFNLHFCYVAGGHPKAVVKTSGKEIFELTSSKVLTISD